jgi:hypothetical protein
MTTQQTASSTDLASLAMRARDAYDQKRTKECLTLTKSLLMLDPDNVDAKSLQSAIRSDIQRNLDDARTLLEDSRRNDNLSEHRKAAEILLLKILYLDPDHEEAKKILASTKAPTPSAHVAGPTPFAAYSMAPVETPVHASKVDVPESAEPIFAVEYRKVEKPAAKKSRGKLPLAVAGLVLLAGVLIVTGQSHFKNQAASPLPASAQAKQPQAQPAPVPLPVANTYPDIRIPEVVQPALQTVTEKELPAPSAIAPPRPPAPAPVVPGTLAVSSPTPAEIYEGDKYLGSTPITLELPPGNHNLEYRHGDLRQFVNHVVKPRESTTAMVTFDVTVQINARPWAQVSIDGAQRRSLGQTPLSDIRVPVGSLLVFENPNFPAKTYRVTGKDTAIRMVFP